MLHAVTVPDLGMPGVAIVVSVWLVPLGAHVSRATAWWNCWRRRGGRSRRRRSSGVFCQRHVQEDERVMPGQVLGLIKSRPTEVAGSERMRDELAGILDAGLPS